eukprot:1990125-Pleurochrysis_carterae.AAC.1
MPFSFRATSSSFSVHASSFALPTDTRPSGSLLPIAGAEEAVAVSESECALRWLVLPSSEAAAEIVEAGVRCLVDFRRPPGDGSSRLTTSGSPPPAAPS